MGKERMTVLFDNYFKGCGGETLPGRDAEEGRSGVLRFCTRAENDFSERLRAFCTEQGTEASVFFTLAFGLTLKAYTDAEETFFTACLSDESFSGRRFPIRADCEAGQSVSAVLAQFGEYLRTADSLEDDCLTELSERSGICGKVLFRCCADTYDDSHLSGEAPSLMLTVSCAKGAYACETAYDAAAYSDYTARGFSRLFAQISEELLIRGTVGEIRLLSPDQESELRNFYDTDWPVEERPAYRLLQDTAEKLPEKTALIAVDRTMSYRELNEEANAVGHVLRDAGAGPETIVAVLAERNSWAYVMRQGALKSGGAFMPVDPEYPDERIRYILENSGAGLVLTTRGVFHKREALLTALSGEGLQILFAEDAAAAGKRDNLNIPVPPEALAYVIYTSGSTGKPKGVMLTNRNLVHYADENPKNYETLAYTRHGSVSIAIAAFTFDVSITEEFIPFAHGMTNVLATREQTLDAVAMRDLILENGVDAIDGTPSYYLNLLEIEAFLPAVRQLKMLDAGAEAFPAALYEKLAAINPDLYIVNTYGPTECTVSCTLKEVTDSRNITIGTPLSNMRMATIDRWGRLQPLGAQGEMVILGDGVGRGYIGLEEQTKKSFLRLMGLPAYRSGDLVRILSNGEIEFHGRLDNQVKLRGLRVELGEVENVLNSFPGIRTSIVRVVHGETDYLGAWFTADCEISVRELKEHMASRLTAYMVPQAFLQLPEMPLTANGKIDKKALPELSFEEEEIVAPENETEEKLLEMVVRLTGNKKIGVTSDLFASGLSSITSIRLCVLIAEEFGRNIKSAELYDYSTVRSLGALIAEKPVIAEDVYALQHDYPISMTQMGIYFETERYPDTTIYNIPSIYHLDDTLDLERFCLAVQTAVAAHPYLLAHIIRTAEGQVRAVRRDGLPFAVSIISCESLPDDETLMRPFNFQSDSPLFRAELYTTPKGNYFLLDTHHIVSDGVSIEILERDIERAYAGETLEKERYTGYEFALDEEKARQSSRYQEASAFYNGVFSGINGETLPPQDGKKCEEHLLRLRRRGTISAQAVRDFCGKNGLTLNAFFTFAFGVALKAYTGSEEAVFSTIYNGRNDPRLTDTVCMLVKTLPVRLALEKNGNVLAGIEACRRYLVSAMANDVFNFAEIRGAFGMTGDALFAYQGEFQHCAIFGGKPAALRVPVLSQAMSAIGVELYTDGDTLLYDGEIDPAKYSEYTLDGLMGTLDHVIGELLEKETLGEITLLSEEEEQKVRTLHDTDFPVAERPAYRLLQDTAEKLPKKTALIAVDRPLTYRELNEEANAVGHALHQAGAGPEAIVAVLAERSSWAYVMRQGVLKSGAAFLPIDPEYPDERISFILEDSGAKLLLTTKSVLQKRGALFDGLAARGIAVIEAEEAVSRHERDDLNLDVPFDALAYVIYTSGSTGKPKGVMLTNRNLVNFVDDNEKNREVQGYTRRGSVSLAVAALTFDFAIMEEFVPLSNGMTVVLATQEQIMNPALLRELMLRNRVDVMSCTPGYLSNLAAIDSFVPAIRGLKSVDFGAEAFPPALFGKLRALNPELYIMNGYGPTEATISCTMEALESGEDITIGIPNANVHVATLDRDGRLQPLGATGEMVILGEGVGRGYVGRDDLTKQSFIRLLDKPAYRSGDLVRLRRDGKIEFHGRMDNQVKLRGLRIELGEIESVLNSYPGVRSSIVQVLHGETDTLGAWFTADHEIPLAELKAHMASRLTAYMIPQVFLQLPEMPLNANGKIDKKALPTLTPEGETIAAPETKLQEQLLDMVKEPVGSTEIGVDTDLFTVGLSSIGCIRLIALAEDRLGIIIRISELFESRTIRRLEALLGERETEAEDSHAVQSEYPLSMTQMGIFVESVRYAGTTIYNIPALYRLDARVNLEKLRSAVSRTVLAHPYLSMTLRQDKNQNVAAVRNPPQAPDIQIETCVPDPKGLVQPFDLTAGLPLYRIRLFDSPEGKYLFLDFHHILMDGASFDIFLRDANRAYEDETLTPERYTGYEFALDEQKIRASGQYEKARDFYAGIFADCEPCTLPIKESSSPAEQFGSGRKAGKTPADRVRSFCAGHGISENTFFTAAFGLTLKAYTASEEAVFSTIYNGRNDPRLSDSISMYVKTLPVLIKGDANQKIGELLSECQQYLIAAMSHDSFSFAEIHDLCGIRADALFDYRGDSRNTAETTIGGFAAVEELLEESGHDQAKAAIDMSVALEDEKIVYQYEYDAGHYSVYTMDGFVGMMDQIVQDLLEKETLGEITLLSEEEEQKVRTLHDTDFPVAERPAYRLLQDTAEKLPEKTALIAVDRTLTYKELNEEANAVGHALHQAGAGPESIVAVLAERSSWAYVMRQGVLKSGAAFLPIDPEYPDERISFILADSGAKLLLTTKSVLQKRGALFDGLAARDVAVIEAEEAVSRHERDNLNLDVPFDALAYVIYTSGSTGKPKGVMLTNRNLVNFVDDNEKNREVQGYTKRGSVSLAIAALTFDFAIMEEFVPLSNGMTVVLATREQIMNPAAITELMLRNRVDVMSCTPSYLANLITIDAFVPAVQGLRSVDFGAEAFPSALFGKLRALNPELYIMNGYGPTEATISCTMEALESGSDITIGIPNANVHVATLDRDGRLQPLGAMGEMVILGEGVGRGYINRDDLTTKNFITLLGRPAYRSGDLVRLRRDGKIEFHGRMDNQVKLRGLRIELGEIESVLNSYPGVKSSIVVVNPEENCLAAYFTADAKTEIDNVKRHLSAYLTAYMVPQVIMQLDSMPLTPNGKIDKKALPVPHREKKERVIVPPSTDLQRTICDMFQKALELDEVGITEDFFELGGTSLKASVVLMSAMLQDLPITYQDIFNAPTAEGLENLIQERQKKSAAGPELAEEKAADCLSCNSNAHLDELEREPLGNVLLTGAAGFLGIHVLRDLLQNTDEKVYCLLRRHRLDPEEALKSSLYYYFETSYEELFGTRLFVVEGDITQPDSLRDTLTLDYHTVINCAACVKHFANIEFLKDVNLRGVENLTELCLEKGARLIQVSTVSVAGDAVGGIRETQLLREDRLDMGQEVQSNAYVYTKYLAEKHILRCITEKGLDAKIIRAGNLSSRVRDGEFQMNFRTNAFMNSLRAYAVLGCYPLPAMSDTEEISYIDETARALVLLAGTSRQFTVFHAYNSHTIEMGSIIRSMNALGIKIEVVKNAEFERRLQAGLANERINRYLAPLVNYSLTDDDQREEIPAENYFTTNVLYHLDFAWTITDLEIIKKMIESMNTLGFFDVN